MYVYLHVICNVNVSAFNSNGKQDRMVFDNLSLAALIIIILRLPLSGFRSS